MASKLKLMSDFLKSNDLEAKFLETLGIKSLDEFSPLNFEDPYPNQAPVVTQSTVSAARQTPKPADKSIADAKEQQPFTVASDILAPFAGHHVRYAPHMELSSYAPSSLMMDYVVHQINSNLVDSFYFKRNCPDYHPYILRLYFAILFWIQCLRAGHNASALTSSQHQFISRFLDTHPLESLTIPGPLIPLFKTLCSSQPEILTYGKVHPSLPSRAGPRRRSDFVLNDVANAALPNVPGIIALLEDLNSKINGAQPTYPKKGMHVPVPAASLQAVIFGHHSFPIPTERTDLDKWSLCSSGLQYPCEADQKLNESFAERYRYFSFPTTYANDCLTEVEHFLSMGRSMSWFSKVKNVAAEASAFFNGSGTLADCSPHGICANQFFIEIATPEELPAAPTQSADEGAQFPFAYRLSTSCRSPPTAADTMAAMAQTNVKMFSTHPHLGALGHTTLNGDFWDIRPIEKSSIDSSTYLTIIDSVKKMMKSKA